MLSFSPLDRCLIEIQHAIKTCHIIPAEKQRPYPANSSAPESLTEAEKHHSAGLMRVNNAGEVAAQALYRGQSIMARDDNLKSQLSEAAEEENDHLRWCQNRLEELGSHRSLLDPVWYAGSFSIGVLAAAAGDKWSLGFVEETEKQVGEHLQSHLDHLPKSDIRSREILEQMAVDEAKHATQAKLAGAKPLPLPVRKLMTLVSKVMTFSAYRI